MSLDPIGDRILVQYDEAETVSKGGIVIPDTAREYQWEGTVLALGPGTVTADGTLLPIRDIKPGDRVLLEPAKGVKLVDPSREKDRLLVVRASDVIAVIRS